MTAEDASEAVRQGVDGIWISNHGARQLDTTPATIEVLPEASQSSRNMGTDTVGVHPFQRTHGRFRHYVVDLVVILQSFSTGLVLCLCFHFFM